MLPNQNIPERSKDREWMKRNAHSILQLASYNRGQKEKDKFCYNMYNGIQNESDFDYLRKVGDYEYPAKIRFIPLLRPRFDRMRGEETKRPFNWKTYSVDSESLFDKNQKKYESVIALISANRKAIYNQYTNALKQVEQQRGMLQAQAQQAQQEGQQIPPDVQMQLDQIDSQLEAVQYQFSNQVAISKKELEEIEHYYRYEFQDRREVLINKGLRHYMQMYNIKDIWTRGFDDKTVTDKEIYYCDWDGISPDPEFRKVNILGFYYASDSEIEWIHEAEWCLEERYMSIASVIDELGDEIGFEDMEKLKSRSYYHSVSDGYGYGNYGYNGSNASSSTSQYGNSNVDGCGPDGLYAGSDDYGQLVRVSKVYWRSPRKVNFKFSPNKYNPSSPHVKLMKDGDLIREDKGEKKKTRYVNDMYSATIIDSDIYLRMHKVKSIRSKDNPSEIKLPYIGRAHNNYDRKPYSLMWAAKDVQILWNLIHYHKELMLALSGVKGFIMDKSQVPEGMSIKEWMYQRKIGAGWIQSVRSGLNKQPTFNQFQSYDDSLSPGIQYLTGILEHLDGLASSITGVSRNRMGDVAPTDQVGTAEMSINESSLVTEMIYHEHDQVKRESLSRLANLCAKAWKKGKRGQFIYGDLGQEILDIPENLVDRADYRVYITDGAKEKQAMRDLKQIAVNRQSQGLLDFRGLAKMYSIDSLKELEAAIDKYSTIAEQKQSESVQQQQQHEQQMKQADNELKLMIDKQSEDAKNMMAKLEQAKFQFEQQKFAIETQLKQQEIQQDGFLKNKELDNEQVMEGAHLQQQRTDSAANYELGKAGLMIDAVDAETNRIGQAQQPKEHVSDR